MHGNTFFQKKSGLLFRIGESMTSMMGAIDIDGNE